jgi:hypothetical protein
MSSRERGSSDPHLHDRDHGPAPDRDTPCRVCIDGWVYLGIEEVGQERVEAVPCKRCNKRS